MRSVIISDPVPRAVEICSALRSVLGGSSLTGVVHSVFHTSVNLLFGEQMITLLSENRPLYPYSLRVSCADFVGFEPGIPAQITYDTVTFPSLGRQIPLGGAEEADLTLASLSGTLSAPTPRVWQELRSLILTNGKIDGFAPLLWLLEGTEPTAESNLYADFAAKRIPKLFEAITAKNAGDAGAAAYSIAGCGIGLTPSADDFMCGIMAMLKTESILRGEEKELQPLITAIAQAAAPRTNLVSATFLREAALGLVSQDVRELMKSIYSCVLSQSLKTSAMNVIAFGETSGTDILTGIYFGQKIYPN